MLPLIGFDIGIIDGRGTTTATMDYAKYCEELLNYNVIIFHEKNGNHPEQHLNLVKNFNCVSYDKGTDFLKFTERFNLDAVHFFKSGHNDGRLASCGRNLVHVVFREYQPHGDIYAAVSKWLSISLTNGKMPYVPHVIKEFKQVRSLRGTYNIPEDAFVVGRFGGWDQFNIEFAHRAIKDVLDKRKNIYFLFWNTKPFCTHERVIFNGYYPPELKENVLSTVDVGLNARIMGESFGISNAEMLSAGKPVFAWKGGMDRNHVQMIPKGHWLYRNYDELFYLLKNYEPSSSDQEIARLAVQKYRPEPVMKIFDEVFMKGAIRNYPKISLFHNYKSRIIYKINKKIYRKWLNS